MIKSRWLIGALTLAEHRNYARAAKALNISQPTLSRSIQLLEKTVGERLFDRLSRTVQPTQAGKILLKHARTILASSEAMEAEMRKHRGILEGSLRIGSGPYPGNALLPPAIGRFSRKYPYIDIEIIVDHWHRIEQRLMQENFDFAVMETSQLEYSQNFELLELNRHQAFFFCNKDHPLLESDNLTITDLSEFPLISTFLPKRLKGFLHRLLLKDAEAENASRTLTHIVCNDMATIKASILHSEAIGIGTYGTLHPELEAGLYSVLQFKISGLTTYYDIVKRKGLSSSPAARAFIETLIEIDNEQSELELGLVDSLGPPWESSEFRV